MYFITIFRLAIPAFFRFTDVTELMKQSQYYIDGEWRILLLKRLKEGVPALTSFPRRFPEKMGGVGTALLQYLYLYLTLSVCSHFDWEIAGKMYVFLTPSKTDGRVSSKGYLQYACLLYTSDAADE